MSRCRSNLDLGTSHIPFQLSSTHAVRGSSSLPTSHIAGLDARCIVMLIADAAPSFVNFGRSHSSCPMPMQTSGTGKQSRSLLLPHTWWKK